VSATIPAFTAGSYKTDLKPVWCAGCGDFGVLTGVYRAMAELQWEPWNSVVVSGIGCSSRLPGYVATYGFNGIHGRALTLATGIKAARPELHVVAVGGDGDGLAIGGNHLLHSARRNLDVTYLLMDNEIYGLTKGQVAPTTPQGDKTKSTYYGNPEPPFDPCELAISFGATWVGRAFSGDVKGTVDLIVKAMKHHGFAFLNIMSPCVTWRGEDQFKTFKAKAKPIPAGHDPTSRAEAIKYTREKDIMSLGVLYEVHQPSLTDRLGDLKKRAKKDPPPTTQDILKTFLPTL